MIDVILDKHNIVHLAALLQLCGFAFKDQIVLRTLIIAGSWIYILYYFFAPETPLWGGIFWSFTFSIVNVFMIFRILRDLKPWKMSADEARLFALLDGFPPGEFRRLLRAGVSKIAADEMTLTREGATLHEIAFVLEGVVTVEKAGSRFTVAPPLFIGEVAFILNAPASATVRLEQGSRYIVWRSETLRALSVRSPTLRSSFAAALNRDMATKIAAPRTAETGPPRSAMG